MKVSANVCIIFLYICSEKLNACPLMDGFWFVIALIAGLNAWKQTIY
jgi:hypothetical protein